MNETNYVAQECDSAPGTNQACDISCEFALTS
jgi:hypothetical protein